jgi:hypothetical protein
MNRSCTQFHSKHNNLLVLLVYYCVLRASKYQGIIGNVVVLVEISLNFHGRCRLTENISHFCPTLHLLYTILLLLASKTTAFQHCRTLPCPYNAFTRPPTLFRNPSTPPHSFPFIEEPINFFKSEVCRFGVAEVLEQMRKYVYLSSCGKGLLTYDKRDERKV